MDNIDGPGEDNLNIVFSIAATLPALYMSQLKYDIAEFIVNNREEIILHLEKDMEPILNCERIFAGYPEMFDGFADKHRCVLLANYLSNFFPCALESLYLIIDPEFVKLTLYS